MRARVRESTPCADGRSVIRCVALSLCCCLGPAGVARFADAQTPGGMGIQPSRDPSVRAIGALRARVEYEQAATEFARSRELHERRMLSDSELAARRLDADRARMAYWEAMIAATPDAPSTPWVGRCASATIRPIPATSSRTPAAVTGSCAVP